MGKGALSNERSPSLPQVSRYVLDIFVRAAFHRKESGIVTAMVGMLQAPPGTRLFERLAREQRVCTAFSGDNVDGRTNIIPAMGLDKLIGTLIR